MIEKRSRSIVKELFNFKVWIEHHRIFPDRCYYGWELYSKNSITLYASHFFSVRRQGWYVIHGKNEVGKFLWLEIRWKSRITKLLSEAFSSRKMHLKVSRVYVHLTKMTLWILLQTSRFLCETVSRLVYYQYLPINAFLGYINTLNVCTGIRNVSR